MISVRRVLVVSSVSERQQAIISALAELGYAVTSSQYDEASDLYAALRLATWDIALCDYDGKMFGGPDRLSVAAEICKSRCPVVFFSGRASAETVSDLLKNGAFDCIDRMETDRLLDAVETINNIIDGRDRRYRTLQDEFIATVSHEVRTPLTSIVAALGLINESQLNNLPASVRRLVNIALLNSRRLSNLVNDILDIEKVENGRVELDLVSKNARSLIVDAMEAMRDVADINGISLRLDRCVSDEYISVDTDRFGQALKNVLSNAIKFSPRGSDVLVGADLRGPDVDIFVRDFGAGVPYAYREAIFNKFARVDTTDARRQGGVGLGLSLVKEIIAKLNGTVDLEAAQDCGTIFHLLLPRVPSPKLAT